MNSVCDDADEIVEKMIHVGVCCMAKKLLSKPMQCIIKHLEAYNELQVTQFDEELILNAPIEDWPKVDVLISFYSSGFPMEKGLKYVNAYKPIQINDLEAQKALWDRRKIYEILKANNIPMAKHYFVERKS
jgi:inositol hexakisphosphate/diphosphoinositol-pentakisphosphate kinase